jgi:hypothetical protein
VFCVSRLYYRPISGEVVRKYKYQFTLFCRESKSSRVVPNLAHGYFFFIISFARHIISYASQITDFYRSFYGSHVCILNR